MDYTGIAQIDSLISENSDYCIHLVGDICVDASSHGTRSEARSPHCVTRSELDLIERVSLQPHMLGFADCSSGGCGGADGSSVLSDLAGVTLVGLWRVP